VGPGWLPRSSSPPLSHRAPVLFVAVAKRANAGGRGEETMLGPVCFLPFSASPCFSLEWNGLLLNQGFSREPGWPRQERAPYFFLYVQAPGLHEWVGPSTSH
jgi:hypothetical protein